jgi:hypothetical protein
METRATDQARESLKQRRVERVAKAIARAWGNIGDVPFPLYEREAEVLAKAAIAALSE